MLVADHEIAGLKAILRSNGWVVLRGLPVVADGGPDIPRILHIARLFGRPSDRDGGTPAWQVKPMTDAPSQTFSLRTGGAPLHTDAQYRREPEPLVCLFAVRPAADGGTTRVLTVPELLATMRGHPNGGWLLRQLARTEWAWRVPSAFPPERPFRAAVLPGDGTIRWRDDNLAPDLDGNLRTAAAGLGICLEAMPGVVEVPLGAGDAIVLDNRRVLHGRTAFTDRRRLMVRVRLWEPA